MVTVKCDMCGKDISNHAERTTISFPKEDCFVCYDVCRDCTNKIEEFIKATHNKEENKCNREKCKGCDFFGSMESPLLLNKLRIRCNKTNQFRVVDLEHTVKPEDFYEED